MENALDKISQALGTATGLEYDAPTPAVIEDIVDTMKSALRKNNSEDYQFVRDQLKSAIKEAAQMIPGLVGLAKVAESPNLYNSASGFFDSFVKLNQALVDNGVKMDKAISTDSKTGKPEPVKPAELSGPPVEGENKESVAFEGTTEQLLDLVLRTKVAEQVNAPIDVQSAFVDSH